MSLSRIYSTGYSHFIVFFFFCFIILFMRSLITHANVRVTARAYVRHTGVRARAPRGWQSKRYCGERVKTRQSLACVHESRESECVCLVAAVCNNIKYNIKYRSSCTGHVYSYIYVLRMSNVTKRKEKKPKRFRMTLRFPPSHGYSSPPLGANVQ